MIEEVFTDIYRIEIPLPGNPLKFLNSYLVKGHERNLLIDTGFNQDECRKAMLAGLKELEVDLEKTDFFITHMHADHSGLISSLVTDKSRVYCSGIDAKLINYCSSGVFWSEMHKLLSKHGLPLHELNKAIEEHPAKKYNTGRQINFNIVKENDTLQVGDYIFKCVGTPGHTPGHMCLYETNNRILISGDHVLDEITPIIKTTKWAQDSLGDYLTSLVKTGQLEISLTLPAHRRIIDNIHQRIRELKQHHETRLVEVLNIVSEGRMTGYQVASKMTWDIKYPSWELFPVTQKWFATTEAVSHLIFLCNQKMVQRIDNEEKIFFELVT